MSVKQHKKHEGDAVKMPHVFRVDLGENLQKVLDSADSGSIIELSEGVWREKIVVRVPNLTIVGAGADKTRLVYGDYARKIHADGREYNTFRTYTAAVCADGVSMRGLTVENDALAPEAKGQEVALTVYGDGFSMEDCALLSTQDTLFLGPLPPDLCERYVDLLPQELRENRPMRQRFKNCLIAGTVDFIFGCGEAAFEDCEIRSVYDVRGIGYCAAPAHTLAQNEGFTFKSCRFTRKEGVADDTIFLARPWRDYGLAQFEDCAYDAHIAREGFDKWNDTQRDKTARFYETPVIKGRANWINRKINY